MSPAPLAAGIAFFALGANFLGAGLLLLFNPRSREVRWYLPFLLLIMAWLLAQGLLAAGTDRAGAWAVVMGVAVTMLPATFLGFTLAGAAGGPTWQGLAANALGLLALPVLLPPYATGGWSGADQALTGVWQAVTWTVASVLLFRQQSRDRAGPVDAIGRVVIGFFLVLAPLVVAVAFLAGPPGFFLYAMPIITVGVQFMTFLGVVRLRFYDIEVRAARTGELAAQSAETERLAVLGELAASVAHEVRNPLTGVRSLAQRIAEDDVDAERRRRYAGVILEETGRLERIVSNLLSVAHNTNRHRWRGGPTPLAELFEDLELLAGSRAERAGVRLERDAAGLAVGAPREPLAQALLNLLLNAVEHSPRGGVVLLMAEPEGDAVRIAVRDQGPGIPEAERARVFEPFRSGRGGTGLGLSVVRRLAEELEWGVAVADAPGGGAELRLRVPAAATVGA